MTSKIETAVAAALLAAMLMTGIAAGHSVSTAKASDGGTVALDSVTTAVAMQEAPLWWEAPTWRVAPAWWEAPTCRRATAI